MNSPKKKKFSHFLSMAMNSRTLCAFAAQRAAEEARAALEKAKLEADIVVKAEIRKKELELQAEAEAEQIERGDMNETNNTTDSADTGENDSSAGDSSEN